MLQDIVLHWLIVLKNMVIQYLTATADIYDHHSDSSHFNCSHCDSCHTESIHCDSSHLRVTLKQQLSQQLQQ